MKKYSKFFAVLLAIAMVLPGIAQAAPVAEEVKVERLAGSDRVETSIKVSQKAYDKADTVVLAGYNGEADALTGTLLANAKKAPLLLTYKDKLDTKLVAELNRLGAKNVYILGGDTVVFPAVETALEDAGFKPTRLKGNTRVETAIAIANEVLGTTTPAEAFVVEYNALADALAVGSVSAMKNAPILITYKNDVPAKTVEAVKAMQLKKATIVGGVVSDKGKAELEKSIATVNVVAGSNREETALKVAKEFVTNPKAVVMANGYKYADALVGGYFAAMHNAPMLLSQATKVNAEVLDYVKAAHVNTFVLGGETVVNKVVFDKVVDAVKGEVKDELKLESVSAITNKTLEVKFNKAVDSTKATVEVVKSNIKQNSSKTTWAADNKSVQLELSAKLNKGDYTVNVKGLTDEVLTKTVTVEDERVESIEILSDIAVVNDTTTPTSATVGYQVKNQYGEDITKTTSLTTNNPSNIVASNGVVTLNSTAIGGSAKVGDKVAVALVHAESAKSATKVVTLSAAASVAEVKINGLYNKDGKQLNEATNLTNDKFYLLVEAKDQYGNVITDKTKAQSGLIKSETNPTVVLTSGLTPSITLTDLTIDGKKVLGLEVTAPGSGKKAGESIVTLISTTTGKNASYTIKVAETTRTDVINLSGPALSVAKEDILVPVSVTDKDGNAVTDVKILNTVGKGVSVTFGGTQISSPFTKDKDGNVFIKVPFGNNLSAGTVALVAQTSTFKVATLTIKVEAEAIPKTIRGLKSPLALTTAGATKTLTVADVVVEDQYGREMKSADVVTYLNTNSKGILIEKVDASSTVVSLPAGAIANQTIKHDTGVDVTGGAANGREVLRFVLANNDGTNKIAASAAESTVRVTDGKEYTGYEISPIGKVQASDVEAAGNKAFTVNGILNGGKVALATTDYTSTISGGKGTPSIIANNAINVALANLNNSVSATTVTDATNAVDTEFTLKVTINATGQVIEQKFIVSADNKKVQDFFFTTAGTGTTEAVYKAAEAAVVTKAGKLNSGSVVATAALFEDAAGTNGINVATIDQYGNKSVVALGSQHKVTIIPEKITEVNITNNGTATATATLVAGVSEANVTLKIQLGNAIKEIKAVVK